MRDNPGCVTAGISRHLPAPRACGTPARPAHPAPV